jgi:hypothetical protein
MLDDARRLQARRDAPSTTLDRPRAAARPLRPLRPPDAPPLLAPRGPGRRGRSGGLAAAAPRRVAPCPGQGRCPQFCAPLGCGGRSMKRRAPAGRAPAPTPLSASVPARAGAPRDITETTRDSFVRRAVGAAARRGARHRAAGVTGRGQRTGQGGYMSPRRAPLAPVYGTAAACPSVAPGPRRAPLPPPQPASARRRPAAPRRAAAAGTGAARPRAARTAQHGRSVRGSAVQRRG